MPETRPYELSSLDEPLSQVLSRLDWFARYFLETKEGEPKGFLLQTILDFVGLTTVISLGDFLGVMRGYLSLRERQNTKGALQVITAVLPFIPTGPVHFMIEKLLPSPSRTSQQSTPAKVIK